MEPSSNRFMPVLLALVVGVGIGWLVFRPQAAPPQAVPAPTATAAPAPTPMPKPSNHLIIVGPDPTTLSEPKALIGWENRVVWMSDSGQSLEIRFPVSGFPSETKLPPFPDMRRIKVDGDQKDYYVFQHPLSKSVTFSGMPNPALRSEQATPEHPKGTLEYTYDQKLGGESSDGMIIIEK